MIQWRMYAAVPVMTLTLALAGCGNGEPGDPGEADNNAQPEAADVPSGTIPEPMQAFEDDGDVLELVIEGDDRMQFNLDRFSVQAGQMVRLRLDHVGQLPAQSMGHNVVILYPDDDAAEFGADVNEQGGSMDNDYVPEPLRDRVLAFTEMIGGGETTTVEFQAPDEPGEYPFLCSFPGHAGMMNGLMEVED